MSGGPTDSSNEQLLGECEERMARDTHSALFRLSVPMSTSTGITASSVYKSTGQVLEEARRMIETNAPYSEENEKMMLTKLSDHERLLRAFISMLPDSDKKGAVSLAAQCWLTCCQLQVRLLENEGVQVDA